MVISTDLLNSRTSVVVVAAVTAKKKQWCPSVTVNLPAGRPLRHECQILVFQVPTVDKARLTECKGQLDANQVEELKKRHARDMGALTHWYPDRVSALIFHGVEGLVEGWRWQGGGSWIQDSSNSALTLVHIGHQPVQRATLCWAL